ncbi:LysR family transcriptional regulator [Burkholderia cenocepacia]|jgi:DNA-binding transcriptional LysR family regulator|uniref:LysR family transcriptional regulator n=1 Tax=Burkholderia TaxID=32008 RepID=UPI00078DDBBF|nr:MULTISPECIES: LysR family transcriptional regulator [Burkholderia]AMU18520.1 LysR family transcriptional regulator [Burkholderia cenocepacia]MBG0874067.1 LysR family transcriptional regulator [Burkholderia sp. 9777_1386]MCW3588703.1 LysR family transcriptional regulator [Burkholderia cenocepacia]MCW3633678.1 LysR family transcriptional regulator [Burkholderia cenocepacia]MCW3648645.1 LysR family transcriptional regulator [Burkholderia cenocepacia]
MNRDDLIDLNAFVAVAEERSFTRAAARLLTSQSALSHTLRRLETRLGVRLLTRTTRSVALTPAGETFLQGLKPAFEAIDLTLGTVGSLRESPRGTLRITTPRHAAVSVLWPVLQKFVRDYPDIQVEVNIDAAFRDLADDRFDAGIRLGELVAPNMVAVKIGPDLRLAIVATPGYVAQRGIPTHPHQLAQHACINFRLPGSGALYAWQFKKGQQEMKVRVEGPLTFDDPDMILAAAVDGQGISCLVEDHAAPMIRDGRLVRLLEDWCSPFSGYHLYYPTRKNKSAAFRLLVDRLRTQP